jgi:hypothetical protein
MLKKILSIFISITLLTSSSFAVTPDRDSIGADLSSLSGDQQTQLKAPLFNLFSSTDWGLFLKMFEIKLKVKFCGEGLDKAIGFKARMIEPVGYFETTKRPLYFPFADLDLGGNIKKSGHTRATITSEGGRDEFVWSHFIYIPIMGMIFKKKIPIFCFARGDLQLPLINEFLPMYSKDLMYKNMIAPMVVMFTPQGLLSTVLDCGATVINHEMEDFDSDMNLGSDGKVENIDVNKVSSEDLESKGEDYVKYVMNSMYFSVGCLGFTPVGGYIEAQDPGVDAELLLYQAINLLHGASSVMPAPFLYKQTNFTANLGSKNDIAMYDTMCEPKKYPMGIQTQYIPQRAYPTVGEAHAMGMTPISTTTAANLPGSNDSFVFVVWELRDYAAFAYFCPSSNSK